MSNVFDDLKPLNIMVVNHLPDEYEVEKGTIYLKRRIVKGVEYYDEYLWYDNNFVLIDSIETTKKKQRYK